MVGGYNYYTDPYNLATEAERQPGSSFKVFDLAAALEDGYKPQHAGLLGAVRLPDAAPFGTFVVRNDEGGYSNAKIPLWQALAVSDNSVFSRVGLIGAPSGRPAERAQEHRRARQAVRDLDDRLVQPVDGDRRPRTSASRRSTWRTPTRRSPNGGRLTPARSPRTPAPAAARATYQSGGRAAGRGQPPARGRSGIQHRSPAARRHTTWHNQTTRRTVPGYPLPTTHAAGDSR